MENFDSLELPTELLQSLKNMGFSKPTPIQAQTIPIALQGSDILGSAQTGTGKTAAYGIPLVAHLLKNTGAALVLAPTRELALQVLDTLKLLLGKNTSIKSALLIGGASIGLQLAQLKNRPRLIVGTPGRLIDHVTRGSLKLNNVNFLVLDEKDQMMDMGFLPQIQQIAKSLPQQRQTLMFSATMSPEVIKIAHTYLKDPIRVSVGSTTTATDRIKQEFISTTEIEKYNLLVEQFAQIKGSFIVFVRTKHGTEKLANRLRLDGHSAGAIHGDMQQRNRERVIRDFRGERINVLVATNVAARGLDLKVECVVNYDPPQCPEDYIHRIGRTGRAGAEGRAVSLMTPQDTLKWRNIRNPDGKNNVGPKTGRGDTSNHKRRNTKKPRFFGQGKSSKTRSIA